MKKMAADEFKVHCLKIMDEVQSKRASVLITKRGKPVAKLVPVDQAKDDIYGFLKGKVKVRGDIVSPVLTREEWGTFTDSPWCARGRMAGGRGASDFDQGAGCD